jgi:hypothetical protein
MARKMNIFYVKNNITFADFLARLHTVLSTTQQAQVLNILYCNTCTLTCGLSDMDMSYFQVSHMLKAFFIPEANFLCII